MFALAFSSNGIQLIDDANERCLLSDSVTQPHRNPSVANFVDPHPLGRLFTKNGASHSVTAECERNTGYEKGSTSWHFFGIFFFFLKYQRFLARNRQDVVFVLESSHGKGLHFLSAKGFLPL